MQGNFSFLKLERQVSISSLTFTKTGSMWQGLEMLSRVFWIVPCHLIFPEVAL